MPSRREPPIDTTKNARGHEWRRAFLSGINWIEELDQLQDLKM